MRALLPEIRVGHRLVVDSGGADPEQFYVEAVSLDFSWPPGTGSTTFTVTHGFRGTDNALLSKLNRASTFFVETT